MKEKSKAIQIWCTLGPSSLNKRVIERLEEAGVNMFRVNLSHTNVEDIEKSVLEIKKYTDVPICLDTEGPQIRTGIVKRGQVYLNKNSIVNIVKDKILGDSKQFNLRPSQVLSSLNEGDLISINFDSALLMIVQKINEQQVKAKVICEGWVLDNIAVMVDRSIYLPILSEKDYIGLEVMKKHKLINLSLSFVNKKEDVDFVRSIISKDIQIISKIETNSALLNLDSIISVSDAILIDRGDLSREESINKIPLLQKIIIKKAKSARRQVFVATNFLESMVKTKKPLRSEVNDIMTTLLDGADGLVLAAETAIGKYPVECANMVKRMIKYYRIAEAGYSLPELLKNDSFLLIEPHGGELVDRYDEDANLQDMDILQKIIVDEFSLVDAEQIAVGTFSPLEGFMTGEAFNEVLDNFRLPEGTTWPLPIILQITEKEYRNINKNIDVTLVYKKDKQIYAVLSIEDVFTVDLRKIAKKWFGTDNMDHPGVKRLFKKGEYCIGGRITLVRRRNCQFKEFEFTPKQMRIIFEHKEWSKVAAFHTRNIVHRADEYILKNALERYNFDGLLLHPVIGPKISLDFLPQIIMESYEILFKRILNQKDKFIFSVFSGYSHFAGPRETAFTAICRKNFGCSHFFVGNNQTKLNNYYKTEHTMKLFDDIDVGIQPIFFDTAYYCKKCKQYVESCNHSKNDFPQIKGSKVKKMFLEGEQPPDWFLRDKILNMILRKIEKGEDVFV